MIRILFVESYPQALFGQQQTLLAILEASRQSDVEAVVAVTGKGPFADEIIRRGFPLILFPYPESISGYGGAIYRKRGIDRVNMLVQVLRYIFWIRQKLREERIDAVFCNDMRGLLTVGIAARSIGIKVMIWDKLDKPHGILDWFQLPIANCNIIISEAVKNKYPVWQKSIFARRISKVYDGVDRALFEQARSIRNTLPAEDGDVLLAIVGSISSRKGLDRILSVWGELMERCPNVRLLVVGATSGSAEDEEYMESLPNRDHPRVHFLGMRKDIPDVMMSIDVLITPSRFEGLGLVLVEAMVCGVPAIGSNTGGIPEVILHEQTGIIIDGDSKEQMIAAVHRLASDPALRARYGAAGRERAIKLFDRKVQMQKVLKLLLEMK